MAYKRILVIQDISCVGQCSMTVALPILSACGHETCILPTAVLSTHTGGFGKPAVFHLDAAVEPMCKHWQENQIAFDAILVGYIGSVKGVEMVSGIVDRLLAEDGVLIVDPALADHGKLYSGLDSAYVAAMEQLCCKADVIIPNITEAALFSGCHYRENLDENYVNQVLKNLKCPCVILTGVGYQEGQTGVVLHTEKKQVHFAHKRIPKNYHGTGDMFAACFTGAWLQTENLEKSVEIAAKYVSKSIENTVNNPAHWYGVKFETALPDLIRMLDL